MKSKIEKLERVKPMSLMGMMGEVAPQWVAKELNKIIDHLNSQDQEEEDQSFDIQTEDEFYQQKKEALQDTPEEEDVQEWEEEWHSTPVYNQISFIKNLLKEREREVLESVLKEADKRGHYYDEDTEYEVIKEMLDKLKDNK